MILTLKSLLGEHYFPNYLENGGFLNKMTVLQCGNISLRLKSIERKKKNDLNPAVLHVSSSLAIPGKRKAHHHHHDDSGLSDHCRKCSNLR